MTRLIITSAILALLLSGCKEDDIIVPDPVSLTEENVSYFCQMNVLEHGGPKAQIHLEGVPAPLFFAQVRDAVAYLKSPERDARVLATYVSDMGVASGWNDAGTDNWIDASGAHFVIDAGVAGGMGAPEVAPFADAGDAKTFADAYGGRIVAITDIPDNSVLGPIDHDATLKVPQ